MHKNKTNNLRGFWPDHVDMSSSSYAYNNILESCLSENIPYRLYWFLKSIFLIFELIDINNSSVLINLSIYFIIVLHTEVQLEEYQIFNDFKNK